MFVNKYTYRGAGREEMLFPTLFFVSCIHSNLAVESPELRLATHMNGSQWNCWKFRRKDQGNLMFLHPVSSLRMCCDGAAIKVQIKTCFIVVYIHFKGSLFRDGDKHLGDNLK